MTTALFDGNKTFLSMSDTSTPSTPSSGIRFYSESGVMKYVNSGGTPVSMASLANINITSQNVLLGAGAAVGASSTGCIAIGNSTAIAASLTNATAIGASASVAISNTISLGTGAKVGINNPAPDSTLSISSIGGVCCLGLAHSSSTPNAPGDGITLYWDGTNLKFKIDTGVVKTITAT